MNGNAVTNSIAEEPRNPQLEGPSRRVGSDSDEGEVGDLLKGFPQAKILEGTHGSEWRILSNKLLDDHTVKQEAVEIPHLEGTKAQGGQEKNFDRSE